MSRCLQLAVTFAVGGGVLLAIGCAGPRSSSGPAETPAAAQPGDGDESETPPPPDELTLQGTLAKTVEAGGWLLKTSDKEYLLLRATSYRTESWFREGTRVEVKGKEARGVMTTYMQGTPFRVSSMKPLSQGGNR